jgi:hypothetical protein
MGAFGFVDRDALILFTPRAPKNCRYRNRKQEVKSSSPALLYMAQHEFWHGNARTGGLCPDIISRQSYIFLQ